MSLRDDEVAYRIVLNYIDHSFESWACIARLRSRVLTLESIACACLIIMTTNLVGGTAQWQRITALLAKAEP